MTLHSVQAAATLAKPVETEASWTFKKAEEDLSFASCDDLDMLLK